MALRPLSRVESFEFPEHTWDVRGWTVRTEAGDEKVGRVDEMLLDHSGTLRYLDVDLGFLKKHVLVPLDHAHADRERETVWIEGLGKEGLEKVPEYRVDPEALGEDYERRLDALYGGTAASRHTRVVAPEEDPDAELSLRRMGDLEEDYRVASEDPRGWKVITAEGDTVGEVVELLMEPAAMKARFLDVAIREKKLDLEPVDRHILLPADRVRLDRSGKKVLVSGLLAQDMGDYPQYGGLPVTRRWTRELDAVFDRAAGADDRGSRDRESEGVRERHDPNHWRTSTLRHFYRSPRRESTNPRDEEELGG